MFHTARRAKSHCESYFLRKLFFAGIFYLFTNLLRTRKFPKPDVFGNLEFAKNLFYIGRVKLVKTGEIVVYKGYLPTDSSFYALRCETKKAPTGQGQIEPCVKVPKFSWRQVDASKFATTQEDIRFPYQEALFRHYPESKEDIGRLPMDVLAKAHKLLTTLPWLLCFKKWSSQLKSLKPLAPKACLDAIKEFSLQPEPCILEAIQVYCSLKREQDYKGDTLFPATTTPSDGKVFPFLVENQALVQTEWGIGLHRDQVISKRLVFGIERIIRNAQSRAPPQQRGWVVPCMHRNTLIEEQRQFAMHVMNYPLSFLNAPPGSGKTEMIGWINCQYARVLNVTFVGSMVEKMQERLGNHPGIVHTIHHITTVAKYIEGPAGTEWLAQYEIIVIDEASNVDEKLLADLLSAIPNATKLVMVGDLDQIFPIDPGCPFNDLVAWIGPEHVNRFVENHRVDPDFIALAAANTAIRNNTIQNIGFSPQGPLRMYARADYYSTLKTAVETLVRDCGLSSVSDLQLVTMRNDDRAKLNEALEQVAHELNIIKKPDKNQMIELSSRMNLFPGKKITFNKTRKSKTHEGVRNGEIALVRDCQYDGKDIVVLTDRGKRILISKSAEGAVLPFECDMAYCITCNKSQGSEWNHVLFWIPPSTIPFTREFAYVAFSRARKSVSVVGTVPELAQLCRGKARPRVTLLSKLLTQIPIPTIPVGELQVDFRPLTGLTVAPIGTPGLFPVPKMQPPKKEPEMESAPKKRRTSKKK